MMAAGQDFGSAQKGKAMKRQKFIKICPYCGNEIYDFIKPEEMYRCRCCKEVFRLEEVLREKLKAKPKRK